MAARRAKIFLSSPGDLKPEREIVDRAVAKLNFALSSRVRFETFRWEESHYTANRGFQEQIDEPATCDVVLVMMGNRLGSKLDAFAKRMPSGEPYPSGTAYELLSALEAGTPDVYLLRKLTDPLFRMSQNAEAQAEAAEKARVDAFLAEHFRSPSGGWKRAFHEFSSADELRRHVEALLREWADKKAPATVAWNYKVDGSPFLGLRAFEFRHRRIYFGRDRKVARAKQELTAAAKRGRPFLLIVGASGAGKSSLARAGVAPALTAPGAVEGVDGWRIAVMRPSGAATPFQAFAQAMFSDPASDSADDDPGGYGPALPELRRLPSGSVAGLAELAEKTPDRAAETMLAALGLAMERERERFGFGDDVRVDLLLIVDQLEEIFEKGVSDAERAAFGRLLMALTSTKRVWVAATLRADLYVRILDNTLPFLALKDNGGAYDLASPGEAELVEILQKSAAAAGLVYEYSLERGESLDERLLRDAKGSDDTLPLLQFALQKLFERCEELPPGDPSGARAKLTHEAYDALRGLDGAIDIVAETAIADIRLELPEERLKLALARLLRRLAVRTDSLAGASATSAGLTLRSTSLEEARADEASRLLVEALIEKRLLVTENAGAREGGQDAAPASETAAGAGAAATPPATLRLAHERILKSWRRAAEIVGEQDRFFRIAAELSHNYQLWSEGNEAPGRLLRDLALGEAEWLMHNHPADLAPIAERLGPDGKDRLARFVKLSGRRARFRQTLTRAAAAVFFGIALLASALAFVAFSAEQEADANYAAAKGAADDLVSSIATDLREQKGIPSTALDVAFAAVDKLLDKIEGTVAKQGRLGGYDPRSLFKRLIGEGQIAAGGGAGDSVALTRAAFLYEFSETYHQAAEDYDQAREKAERSRELLERARARRGSPDVDDALAKVRMEIGDIDRKLVEIRNPIQRDGRSAGDFSRALENYQAADGLLKPLAGRASPKPAWLADRSRSLTRLGDIEAISGDRATARRTYLQAFDFALQVFHGDPDNPEWIRELSWSFRKLGESAGDDATAERSFEDEVCVRRRIAFVNSGKTKWEEDLGYALMKEGNARLRVRPQEIDGAKDAGFEALHLFVDLNASDRFKGAYYLPASAALDLISRAFQAENNAELAQVFAKAAASVKQKTNEAFDSPPVAEPQRSQTLARQGQLKSQGLLGMMDDSRPTVANALQSFEASRLPELQTGWTKCWDEIKHREMISATR